MIRTLAAAIALAVLAMPVAAQDDAVGVASATSVNGPVQVNQGEQFLPMQAGQTVAAGDRVMALANGSAVLTFKDGCSLTVAPETMIVVPAISTCAGGVVTAQAIAPASSEAVGTTGSYASSGGIDGTGFAIVAGTVLIGDAILFAQDNEDEDNTVSP